MNPILITRIADNKTFSEESLAELLREEGIRQFDNILGLGFRAWRSAWFVNIHDHTMPPPHYREFTLDPAKYKISFANTLDIERVREMIEEMKDQIIISPDVPVALTPVAIIDTVALRYLHKGGV